MGSEMQDTVLSDDPTSLINYLRKQVEIKIDTGQVYKGKVYTIDPITKTVILTEKLDGQVKIEVVTAPSIKEILIINEEKEDDI